MSSLANRYRPTTFDQVIGQDSPVRVLRHKIKEKSLPHTIMFTGPTGVGKSTLAMLLAQELHCSMNELYKFNSAEDRGIDFAKTITDICGFRPLGASNRCFLIEEVVQLPKLTQQALLEILENPPRDNYFLLCTTVTTGLLPTFLGRCFQVTLSRLSDDDILRVIERVVTGEEGRIAAPACQSIVKRSQGSARRAIMLTEAALACKNDQEQLQAVDHSSVVDEEKSEFLARLLFRNGVQWQEIARCIAPVEDKDLEGLRRQVLMYAGKVLASGDPKALKVIDAFEKPFFDCGWAGLVKACWLSQRKG